MLKTGYNPINEKFIICHTEKQRQLEAESNCERGDLKLRKIEIWNLHKTIKMTVHFLTNFINFGPSTVSVKIICRE